MKKIIFAAVVAAFALVACSNEENKSCYEVKYTIPEQPEQVDSLGQVTRPKIDATDVTVYKWATDAEIETYKKEWESMKYTGISCTEVTDKDSKAIKTEADCLSLNTPE